MNRFSRLALVAVLCGGSTVIAEPDGLAPRVITADRALGPDGEWLDRVAIVIADGRIAEITTGAAFADAPDVVRCGDAVLVPGLIDLYSSAALDSSRHRRVRAIDPDLSVVDAIDPWSDRLPSTLRAGVTAVLAGPDPVRVVGGTTALVKTWPYGGEGEIDVVRTGPLAMAIGPAVLDNDYGPTSRAGVLFELRSALDLARDTGAGRLAELVGGERRALLVGDDASDVIAAKSLLDSYQIEAALLHTTDAADLSEHARGVRFVVGPYGWQTTPSVLEGAGRLERGGAIVALRGGRDPDDLRRTAALATRYGMSPAAARRAITIEAARLAGVEDRIGSLAVGRDADIVVFSDDPLRLDAKVTQIFVDGERVAWSPPTPSNDVYLRGEP